ncbi:RnfABCDGE type electron transport complex subunit B [Algivirga pacifica]|uniref:Ion-translocating oxidoreductase complex subunit B n=1 Tax=Algivirga pacifica TaxID=1162670 RepID=A0ABP9DEU4_9BACT
MSILTAFIALGGLTLLLALLLVVANKKLYVYEDPRIDQVDNMLPHANCGACGFPGCRPFAEALVAQKTAPSKCTVNTEEGKQAIAAYLGVASGAEEKRVARLACGGGDNVAYRNAQYRGMTSCQASALVAGGDKDCTWGCLGLGDCAVSCTFGAIEMDANGLPRVNEDKCTACGDCVDACPKGLFSIELAENRLWINCKSKKEGDEVLTACQVGCTACGKCVMDAAGLIHMQDNLPVIDYQKGQLTQEPMQRCPTGAIVWLDKEKGIVKGEGAKKIIRKEALGNHCS